jgi:hypothetical protein
MTKKAHTDLTLQEALQVMQDYNQTRWDRIEQQNIWLLEAIHAIMDVLPVADRHRLNEELFKKAN